MLSQKAAQSPATAIGVFRIAHSTSPGIPRIRKASLFASTHPGSPMAIRNANPTMSTLRWLFMSARRRTWIPSAPIIPKSAMYAPPMTGLGIVAISAESFPMKLMTISRIAPVRTTHREATPVRPIRPIFSV